MAFDPATGATLNTTLYGGANLKVRFRSTSAKLTGQTTGGQEIQGSDVIQVVKCWEGSDGMASRMNPGG